MNRRLFIGSMGAASVALGAGRAKPHKPKYIFLMIGDGMGSSQREVAERYARMKYPARSGGLNMNRLMAAGLTATHEVGGKTTDSAAAGTALACGLKTVNGALGLGADLATPLRSVAYDAQDRKMKVGIVTSVPVDHATPAAFYAKVPKRSMYYEIDEELAKCGFDYIAGEPMLGRGKEKDKTPSEQLMKDAGYQMVNDRSAFDALKPGGKVLVEHEMGYAIDGEQEISLADLTQKGIELLNSGDGFFMMVEGGKIDWSGHANDLASNIHETLAFDDAVSVALAFCMKHPHESLLIVTADHETGGLTLAEGGLPKSLPKVIDAQKHSNSHYNTLVKQWKKGGTITPETAFDRLVEAFGLDSLSAGNELNLKSAISAGMAEGDGTPVDIELQKMYGKKNLAVVASMHQLAAQAGAEWTSFGHTNVRVPTTAYGRWADRFAGENDNTDIANNLRQLITDNT
jgi:alkaline phosphatase